MNRLHTPNQFPRIRKPRKQTRSWEQPRRPLADGPHRPANRQGGDD